MQEKTHAHPKPEDARGKICWTVGKNRNNYFSDGQQENKCSHADGELILLSVCKVALHGWWGTGKGCTERLWMKAFKARLDGFLGDLI